MVQSFAALEQSDLLDRLVTYALAAPAEFDLTAVQVPSLLGLEKWLARNVKHPFAPLVRWLTSIRAELESRISHPPQAPTDWRRSSKFSCKCRDCAELRRFLDDASLEKARFPLAKDRRQHLHQIIDGHKLDTTHDTERRGSPYLLVCTKTQASYERALKAHHVDVEQLKKIRNLLDWHDGLTN
jgi:hypothetical protein